MNMDHMKFLELVASVDIQELKKKEATYKGSWKKRGGVGAAMMTLRKIDRIENMLEQFSYDVFAAIKDDPSGEDGTILAEIRDLRRYLLLIEAEHYAARGIKYEEEINKPGTPDDGGHHERMVPSGGR